MGGTKPEERTIHSRIYRIRRAGGSLSIIIPRELVEKYRLHPNMDLVVTWNDTEPSFKVTIPT